MINTKGIEADFKKFFIDQNKTIQDDPEKAYAAFAKILAQQITRAVQEADLTIKNGEIIVLTGAPGSASANPQPITLLRPLK